MGGIRQVVLAITTALLSAGMAFAHPLSPVLLELVETARGAFEVRWKTSLQRVPGSDLQPELPTVCRSVGDVVTREVEGGLERRWTVRCDPSLIGERVGFRGLGAARVDGLVRVELSDGRTVRGVVRAAEPTMMVPAAVERSAVFLDYLRLGFEHILGGIDHLLFVFGLLLLVDGTASLVRTITAFTVGHSVTLSLAALGVVRYPTALMELIIAVSVLLVAIELTRRVPPMSTLMRRWPWAVAGAFGLLHGLGFAGALAEVGLPENEIPAALLSFNAGIEIGQLAFVAAVLPLRSVVRRMFASIPRWAEMVPIYAMGSLAAAWCFERLAAWLAA
jgi:hydrogenase/urease accessory protein HupE